MSFKNSYATKEIKGTKAISNLKQYCLHCYLYICGP